MARRGYSGNWRDSQYYDVPEAVHVADPAHSVIGQTDDSKDWTADPSNLPPGFDQYTDDTAGPDDVADHQIVTRDGLVLDQTSAHDHLNVGDHTTDMGSARAQHWHERPIVGPEETYGKTVVSSFGPDNMQPTYEQLSRGVNSNPINNPPLVMYDGKGFRYGTWEFSERGRLRRFLSRVVREDHGTHPLRPNTVYVPPGPHYLRDVPLWKSFARMIEKVEKRPMIRRTPPGIGEVIVDDGGPGAGPDDSIIGTGF